MKRRDFILSSVGVVGSGLLSQSFAADKLDPVAHNLCLCKGIERLTTDNKSSYTFKAGGQNVTIPLLKMTDKDAVEFANMMCSEHRTCKVYIVKSSKGEFYGVFTVEAQTKVATRLSSEPLVDPKPTEPPKREAGGP